MDVSGLLNAMMTSGVRGSPMANVLGGLAGGGRSGGNLGGLGGVLGGGGMGGAQQGGGHPLGALLSGLAGGGGGGISGGIGGGGGAGGLGDMLGGLLGGGGSVGGGGGGLGDMLGAVLGGGAHSSSTAGGGLLGQLVGGLFGGAGGGVGRSAGMALLGGLASQLLSNMGRGSSAPSPVQAVAAFEQADPGDLESKAMLMVRAMIAAAKADGQIDQQELQAIVEKLEAAGAGPEERAFIEQEIAAPLDIDALVADVTDDLTAAQVLTASTLAINVDTEAERQYLETLASRLNLDLRSA